MAVSVTVRTWDHISSEPLSEGSSARVVVVEVMRGLLGGVLVAQVGLADLANRYGNPVATTTDPGGRARTPRPCDLLMQHVGGRPRAGARGWGSKVEGRLSGARPSLPPLCGGVRLDPRDRVED